MAEATAAAAFLLSSTRLICSRTDSARGICSRTDSVRGSAGKLVTGWDDFCHDSGDDGNDGNEDGGGATVGVDR